MANYKTSGGIDFSITLNNNISELTEVQRKNTYKSIHPILLSKIKQDEKYLAPVQVDSLHQVYLDLAVDFAHGRLDFDWSKVLQLDVVNIINELQEIRQKLFAEKEINKSQGK